MNRQLYVLEPGEDWRETIGAYVDVYVRESARANFGIDNLPKSDLEARRERLLKTWLFVGTAEELVERLRPYSEIGVRHCMVWSTFGYLPDELVRGSLVRLARDVVPHLRNIQPDPAALERYAELAAV
jgi:alkanesulfonate monooxygenase SsuD/methylene tetrahydromethanopterin reductase-like flavin-dependent oxidoreductase (luciferase family)